MTDVEEGSRFSIFDAFPLPAASILSGCGRDRESAIKAAPSTDIVKVVSCLGRIVAGEGASPHRPRSSHHCWNCGFIADPRVARGDILAVLTDHPGSFCRPQRGRAAGSGHREVLCCGVKAPEKYASIAAQESCPGAPGCHSADRLGTAATTAKKDLFESKLDRIDGRRSGGVEFPHCGGGSAARTGHACRTPARFARVDVDLAGKFWRPLSASRDRATVDVERSLVKAPMAGNRPCRLRTGRRSRVGGSGYRRSWRYGEHVRRGRGSHATDFPRIHEGEKAVPPFVGERFCGFPERHRSGDPCARPAPAPCFQPTLSPAPDRRVESK